MLEKSCGATIEQRRLLCRGDRVVVALSGGPDSISLLYYLHTRSKDYGITLFAVHVNHMLRGRQSDDDAEFCKRFCESLQVPVSIRRLDVRALTEETGYGTQEAARTGRYDILAEEALRVRANKVAVGQNLDDQAETVLFRLVRGTGPDGIAGIWPRRHLVPHSGLGSIEVIRPLIGTKRTEIMEYIERHGLGYRVDPTNLKPVYARNSIRLEIIPRLREYNPEVEEAIARFADLAHDQNELLEELASPLLGLITEGEAGVKICAKQARTLSVAAQRHIIRKALELSRGNLRGIGLFHIENVRRVLLGEFEATEVPGARVEIRSGWLHFEMATHNESEHEVKGAQEKVGNEPIELAVPGNTVVSYMGKCVSATILESGEVNCNLRANTDLTRAFIDFEKVRLPITIRGRQEGDSFVPLGMQSKKKLKDFLISKRVDRNERDKIPIFVDGTGSILWVGGLQIDERFRVSENTSRYLVLTLSGFV